MSPSPRQRWRILCSKEFELMGDHDPARVPSNAVHPTHRLWDRFVVLIGRRLGFAYPSSGHAASALAKALSEGWKRSGCTTLEAYYDLLESLPLGSAAWVSLIATLTVGETYFFRHAPQFNLLRSIILPDLIAGRRQSRRVLRLWSAGCATGEEAYSLAMLLHDLLPDPQGWEVHLLATDINQRALAAAEEGLYTRWSFREQADRYRNRHFVAEGPRYRLRDEVRRLVTFRYLNLAEEPAVWPTPDAAAMDLILCRNVTLYFTPEAARAAMQRLCRALAPGGWLLVSPTDPHPEPELGVLRYSHDGTVAFRRATAEPGIAAPLGFEGGMLSLTALASQATGYDGAPSHGSPPRSPITLGGIAGDAPQGEVLSGSSAPWFPLPDPRQAAAERRARVRSYADQGDISRAEALCRDLARSQEVSPQVFLLLGQVLEQQGRRDEALEELRRALYLDPTHVLAWFTLGLFEQRRGHHRPALRALRTALRLVADVPDDQLIPDGDVLTVGRMRQVAQTFLAALGGTT